MEIELKSIILNDNISAFKSLVKKSQYKSTLENFYEVLIKAPKISCLKLICRSVKLSKVEKSKIFLEFAGESDCPISTIEFLIDKGCDVNDVDENGNTLLHRYFLGYYNTNEMFVEFILDNGFDVHAKGENGDTILHTFAKNISKFDESCEYKDSYRKIFNLLIDHGCDIFAENNDGDTPLVSIAHDFGYEGSSYREIKFFEKLMRNKFRK